MGRKTAASIAPLSTFSANGGQPPSTLAAQILRNKPNNSTQNGAPRIDTFDQLLKDFLSDPVVEVAPEKLEENARFITSLTEAVLEYRQKLEPFTPHQGSQQARNCLEAIQITINKHPEILTYNGQDCSPSSAQPPLLLWLVPKLLFIISKESFTGIWPKLTSVLLVCYRSCFEKVSVLDTAVSYERILKGMLESLLWNLEEYADKNTASSRGFSIAIPSLEIMKNLWEPLEQSIALPPGYQLSLSKPNDICSLALALSSTIHEIELLQDRSRPGSSQQASISRLMEASHRIVDCYSKTLRQRCLDRRKIISSLSSTLMSIQSHDLHGASFCLVPWLELISALIALLNPSDTEDVQISLARSLVFTRQLNQFKLRASDALDQMASNLIKQVTSARWSKFNPDFQNAAKLYLLSIKGRFTLPNDVESQLTMTTLERVQPFVTDLMQKAYMKPLDPKRSFSEDDQEVEPSAKRLKIGRRPTSKAQNESLVDWDLRDLVLEDDDSIRLQALGGLNCDQAAQLDEIEAIEFLTEYQTFPCALMLYKITGKWQPAHNQCNICQVQEGAVITDGTGPCDPTQSGCQKDFSAFHESLRTLSGSPLLKNSKEVRILCIQAIGRLMNHLIDVKHLNLRASPLGSYCITAMQSSVREVRLSATHALMPYLKSFLPNRMGYVNRSTIFELLKMIDKRSNLPLQETVLVFWGLIGRMGEETELNIALLELANGLGHPHPMICATAFQEIHYTAIKLNRRPIDLFLPYWRSIAPSMIRDILQRPQKVQQLASLIGLKGGVDELLVMTEVETIPLLAVTKEHAILERIAQARGVNSVQDLVTGSGTILRSVLTRILLECGGSLRVAESLLQETISNLNGRFVDILRVESILTACEVLKIAGDGTETEKAREAFALLAELCVIGSSGHKDREVNGAILDFINRSGLGIMAHFTDMIESARYNLHQSDKRRAMKAIEHYIHFAGKNVEHSLPQVRATLQTAFESNAFVNEAFSAWVELLTSLDDSQSLGDLIEHTFCIAAQQWNSFDLETQKKAKGVLQSMFEDHIQEITSRVAFFPDLCGIDAFEDMRVAIAEDKDELEYNVMIQAFAERCKSDHIVIVRSALKELMTYLHVHQDVIHDSLCGPQPMPEIAQLYRSLFDVMVRFKDQDEEMVNQCAQCIGVLGCVDPNQVESIRAKHGLLVLTNLDAEHEFVDFIAHLLEQVLVVSFRSAPNGRQQSYFAFVMQELLKVSGIRDAVTQRSRNSPALSRWYHISESVQTALLPYMNTKYSLTNGSKPAKLNAWALSARPPNHATWLKGLVFHLLHRPKGRNAVKIFPLISRVVHSHDLTIATYMLPFAVQNVILGGDDSELDFLVNELKSILYRDLNGLSDEDVENVKQCSENVFQVLDYLSRWLQEKNSQIVSYMAKSSRIPVKDQDDVNKIETLMKAIPPRIIAIRAEECKSYSRAIFHYEENIRLSVNKGTALDEQLREMQEVYEQINEPDAIDGISAKLHTIDLPQQVLDHKRSGRWAAALSYYEIEVQEDPENVQAQINLLSCLKECSQYDALLNTVKSHPTQASDFYAAAIPLAAEAAWITGKFEILEQMMTNEGAANSQDFNATMARALLAVRNGNAEQLCTELKDMRATISRSVSHTNTWSLSSTHGQTLKLHMLYELEVMSGLSKIPPYTNVDNLIRVLDRRLDVVGSFTEDKQFILGFRRAVMQLSKQAESVKCDYTANDTRHDLFGQHHISSSWLESSRLARKAKQINAAHDAVLRAANLDEPEAKVEHARLLWMGGFSRKAIQNLEAAINDGSFAKQNFSLAADSVATKSTGAVKTPQNLLIAKSQLLLAKWMDLSGQEKTMAVLERYKEVSKFNQTSDKGHYYLGSYYNKILDSEKVAPAQLQSPNYLTGECTKLVIDNYLRSMYFGPKYLYRTVPKVLTLWLDFAHEIAEANKHIRSGRRDKGRESLEQTYLKEKVSILQKINQQIDKYFLGGRIPAFVPYTSYAQILSRINTTHKETSTTLLAVIEKIVTDYPKQALWSLVAVSRSTVEEKKTIARDLFRKLRNIKQDGLQHVAMSADVLTQLLLDVCQAPITSKGIVSLTKHLQFRAPLDELYPLVIPMQKTLMASLPATDGNLAMKRNKPFAYNNLTVAGFMDEVLVLSSLQKPRKLIIIGSDGNRYPILCKPKDDLRKDQRLMEFNAMIDRALKKDVDASKRKLYIKTYAVTTLNDEHGVLEWVDGLKPLRDIIITSLARSGIKLAFNDIRALLDKACQEPNGVEIFLEKLLPEYPPQLYKWFIENFPEPDLWYNARLRYTRSCGVMSIVGNALGLGDRHGENISIETGSGGVFHVDFNCLFEKGLTFDKPERVPFRLTHNMVHAFGAYECEGPFRMAAEITQRTLKQHEETLMTIMEAFLYDPTTDFGLEKRRRVPGVPDTPAEVLDSVRRKFNCLLKGETVPLSVEGYVDALIRAATDPRNLANMYVGWCPFL